jgi:hypothetical protein
MIPINVRTYKKVVEIIAVSITKDIKDKPTYLIYGMLT